MKKILLLIVCLCSFIGCSFGQDKLISTLDIDEIEVTVKSVQLSANGDTVTVELILQSYLKLPRELKINTFASGIINPAGKTLFYDSMLMGKVRISLADRQNYIHYLLTRDEPISFTIKTPNWQKRWGKPQFFRLALEDHMEQGKFFQVDIPL